MAKPWRIVAIHVGAWITLGLLWLAGGDIRYGGLTILDWTHLLIIAGSVQTLALRLVRIVRALQHDASAQGRPAEPGS